MNGATIGERIRECRKEKGLTQKKLGELCGIKEPNIRKYELGKANPKLETILKIAKALDINEFELMATPHRVFQLKSVKKEQANFIELLYTLGFSVTKLELDKDNTNERYDVYSHRYKWHCIITKSQLEELQKSIMDYALYTSENYFSTLYNEYMINKKNDTDNML